MYPWDRMQLFICVYVLYIHTHTYRGKKSCDVFINMVLKHIRFLVVTLIQDAWNIYKFNNKVGCQEKQLGAWTGQGRQDQPWLSFFI